MKHKVLILGTLGEFTELVKKAKEKGYETVVCDGYADGIARTYADKAYTIPVTDVDAMPDVQGRRCGWNHHIIFRSAPGSVWLKLQTKQDCPVI